MKFEIFLKNGENELCYQYEWRKKEFDSRLQYLRCLSLNDDYKCHYNYYDEERNVNIEYVKNIKIKEIIKELKFIKRNGYETEKAFIELEKETIHFSSIEEIKIYFNKNKKNIIDKIK